MRKGKLQNELAEPQILSETASVMLVEIPLSRA